MLSLPREASAGLECGYADNSTTQRSLNGCIRPCGRAVVVATAERAALGRIRQLAQSAEAPRSQLQQDLDTLGRRLAIGAATPCVADETALHVQATNDGKSYD